jgi:ATP synthase F1 delta subunit
LAVSGQTAPVKAEITSAVELSADDQEQIRQSLVKQYGDGLVFTFQVDPTLLGGLRVRVGDRLMDNSVASRLTKLRESIASVVR